jgi:hypothetical protein
MSHYLSLAANESTRPVELLDLDYLFLDLDYLFLSRSKCLLKARWKTGLQTTDRSDCVKSE